MLVAASAAPQGFGSGSSGVLGSLDMTSLVNMGFSGLSAAEGSLDDLMQQMPALLNMIPQSIKSDIRNVNVILAEACTNMVAKAQRGDNFSYYSQAGMKSTCESINNIAKQVSDAIEDPAWTQYYVDQLKESSRSFKDTSASFGY